MEQNKKRFNKGSDYGRSLIQRSIRELGCCRSIVVDKNDVVLCGNDVFDIATKLGKKIIIVETDGESLVVVKRTDVQADSKKGREIALVDNVTSKKNLVWDADCVTNTMQYDLSFDPRLWDGDDSLVKDFSIEDFFRDSVGMCKQQEQKIQQVRDNDNKDKQQTLFDCF